MNGTDVFDRPMPEIARLTEAASFNPHAKVTTVLIPPSKVTEEIAQRCHCTCPNAANPWHTCVKYCVDTYGCDKGCKRKPRTQDATEKPVHIIQALYGPLNGQHQSTPRAELEAIACALENALPPVCIVTDHINHRDTFRKGRRHCCRISNPMIDIWIRVWKQVDRLGIQNVKIRWFPSHQHKVDGEKWQRRVDRRANAAADKVADWGREVHDLPAQVRTEYSQTEEAAVEYLKWAAYLAAAQHNGNIVPDHDKPQLQRNKRNKRLRCNPTNDQRILNRIPFAQRSSGIAAEHGPSNKPSAENHPINNHTQAQTAAARIARICNRKGFKVKTTNLDIALNADKQIAKRTLQIQTADSTLFTDHVPPSAANGHTMWVGGNSCNPWIWCVKCGAYSNRVVKKLAEPCRGEGSTTAVKALMQGVEPNPTSSKHVDKQHAPSDIHTLTYFFQHPANTAGDRTKVLQAAVHTHNPKDKRLGTKWQSIMQRANIRITPRLRFCNPMQTKKQHDENQTSQATTPSYRPPLANPPRRMVWADVGGRPQEKTVAAAQNRETAIQAARQICIAAYASAYRKHRKAAILAQRGTHNLAIATHNTDGILGIVTAARPRRRRFVIPSAQRHTTIDEMQELFAYKPQKSWDQLCTANAHELLQPNSSAEPIAEPPSDEEDVFGHGGSLD